MLALACATLSCDGFGDNDFKKSFEMLPRAGYRYAEFDCWHPGSLTPAKIRDLRRRCLDAGLVPAAVYSSAFGGGDSHALTKDVAHKLRMMEAARELGCRRIVATGARRGTEGGLEAVIEALRLLAPAAEEMGVLICLENHAGSTLERAEDYGRVLAAVPSPAVGACLDTGHFAAAAVDMDEFIALHGKRINHLHIKENKGTGTARFTRFGEGDTDIARVLDQVLALGYEGFVTVELPPQEDRPTMLEDIILPRRMFAAYERE